MTSMHRWDGTNRRRCAQGTYDVGASPRITTLWGPNPGISCNADVKRLLIKLIWYKWVVG